MQDYYSLQLNKAQTLREWHKQAEKDGLAQEAKQTQPKFFLRFFSKPRYERRTEPALRTSNS
jgi:hypothetical protein